jgi:hypothetical protein
LTRSRWLFLIALGVTACSSATELPGAELRGPGAMALFDGRAATESGAVRKYLAIANMRGDELRLLDVASGKIVPSPGLVFPLSIPSSGRPLFVAAADLGDDVLPGDHPDALAVVVAGGQAVEIVDTWGGEPKVGATTIPLPAGAEVLAMAAIPATVGARLVVALADDDFATPAPSRGRLFVVELKRTTEVGALNPDQIVVGSSATFTIGLNALSLAPGAGLNVVYAATRDDIGSASPAKRGVAKIAIPDVLVDGAVVPVALDAGVGTEQVAVASFPLWNRPESTTSRILQPDTWGAAAVERVVAVPVASECGAPDSPVRCGLLALDTDPAHLALAHEGDVLTTPTLLPLELPATVTGIVATGRSVEAFVTLTSNVGTVQTTGLAAIAAADGKVYLTDLARWTLQSETSAVTGSGRTRVRVASATLTTAGGIGLWGPGGEPPSAAPEDLVARIGVTPGFTPDDDWTLTWQGALPGLSRAAAVRGSDGGGEWLAVQIDAGLADPVAVADLDALGVQSGDVVQLGDAAAPCDVVVRAVSGVIPEPAVLGAPGGAIRFVTPLPTCYASLPVDPIVTIRAGGLILVGRTSGIVERVTVDTATPAALGRRLFYVTEQCTTAECDDNWPDLAFPFPTGPAIRLTAGYVDADGVPTPDAPTAPGVGISFSTASGRVLAARRPVVDKAFVANALASGLLLWDVGTADDGVRVFASYTVGYVLSFWTDASAGSVSTYR